jgi:hypothetical protein
MSNPCRICANPAWADQAGSWVREGIADREVARRLGVNKSLVTRHRQRHVITPLQHQLAIADKGDTPRRERERLAAAAEADTPTLGDLTKAFLSLDGIAADLQTVRDRLERQSNYAEADGARGAVAVLSQAQIRATEVRAKIGGVGGFAPARAADQAAGGTPFHINIIFSSGETVSIAPISGEIPATTIDEEPEES